MKIKYLKSLLYFIGPAIFLFILTRVDVPYVWQLMKTTKLQFLLIAVLCQAMVIILKSERWRSIISLYEKSSFSQIFEATLYGSLYAAFTPARIGEGFKAPLIKSQNLSYTKIFLTIILDRLLDVLIIIIGSYLGLIYLRDIVKIDIYILLLIALVIIVSVFLAYYIIIKLKDKLSPGKIQEGSPKIQTWLRKNFCLIVDHINDLRKQSNFKTVLIKSNSINLLSFIFYFATIYFVALSLDINLSFIFVVFCYSIIALLAILPISISGIGTRDVALIFFFGFLSIPAEKAIAVSLIDLVILHYGTLLILSIVLAIFNFKKFISIKKNERFKSL